MKGDRRQKKKKEQQEIFTKRFKKFKTRIGMLNNQQGSQLTNQEKIKGRWKQYIENLYRRDKSMTDTFEEDS